MKRVLLVLPLLFAVACGDDEDNPNVVGENPEEAITTLELVFKPVGGTTEQEFVATAPDLDAAFEIDDLVIAAGEYTLSIGLRNDLADGDEQNIREEVEEEADDHQLFFTGTNVQSESTPTATNPALTITYADQEADYIDGGSTRPVGLENTVTAVAGTGTLTVTLQHLPGSKEDDLAGLVANQGLDQLPNEADISVDFENFLVQ